MIGRIIGYLLPSLFICSNLFADTIQLKNGENMKGLVVEEHDDRLILSTENGEIAVLRNTIKDIEYDDPAQNFFQIGRAYEDKQRWAEALAYYGKALEVNPELNEAKKASVRVRNLSWSQSAVGPVEEIERRQALYETWDKGRFTEKRAVASKDPKQILSANLGVTLSQEGDWVVLSEVSAKKEGAKAGLRVGDRLAAVDGSSLRYLSAETVRAKFVTPRYSSFTLEYDRDLRLPKSGLEQETRDLGFELKLGTQGLMIARLATDGAASKAGLKEGDLLVSVNGDTTRYLPLKKFMTIFKKNVSETQVKLTVRRAVLLARH